jgi:hypothetical protein
MKMQVLAVGVFPLLRKLSVEVWALMAHTIVFMTPISTLIRCCVSLLENQRVTMMASAVRD